MPAAGSSKARARVITKEERDEAAQVHRAHVLCLAARALLFDAAADDPTVQVGLDIELVYMSAMACD